MIVRSTISPLIAITVVSVGIASAAPFAYIPNSSSDTVSVIDIASNLVVKTIQTPGALLRHAVAISPQGTKAYVQGANAIYVIDTFRNTVATLSVLGGTSIGLALNPSGSRLYALQGTTTTGQVCSINTATNTNSGCVNVGAAPAGVAVSPDGTRAYVTNSNAASVSVVDTDANLVVATIPVGLDPWGVAVNRAGTRVYVTNLSSGTLSVIDSATNAVVDTVTVGAISPGVVVGRDDTRIYVSGSGAVSVIEAATNAVVGTIQVGASPIGISITPKGDRLYVANYVSNNVSVIRTSDQTVIHTITVGQAPIAIGHFIGGGRLLDIDGDGEVFATTDMVLLLRWQLGFRGAALIAGALALPDATRKTAELVEAYLTQLDALGAP